MLFEFDNEVAEIFNNMAVRSIPGYQRAHKSIADIVGGLGYNGFQIWDMGVSTGHGLRSIRDRLSFVFGDNGRFSFHGCDVSTPMVEKARLTCPWATIHEHDLNHGLPDDMLRGKVQCVVFGWVLQFIRNEDVVASLLHDAWSRLAPGGVLFVMEKYRTGVEAIDDMNDASYHAFRLNNGYSAWEITEKTRALKNAMWPRHPDFASSILRASGADTILPLYNSLNFGGIVALKAGA